MFYASWNAQKHTTVADWWSWNENLLTKLYLDVKKIFFSILKHNYSPDYVVPLFETLIHCWKLLNCSKCWGVAKILIEYFKHCYIAENSISIVLTCDFCIFISSSFDHELTYFLITVLMKSPSINWHLSFLRAPYPKRPNSRIK